MEAEDSKQVSKNGEEEDNEESSEEEEHAGSFISIMKRHSILSCRVNVFCYSPMTSVVYSKHCWIRRQYTII